ncbi:hypothetical protein [Streptomyces sp. YS415]|nr:hypothetical protein [Streptomyces sp. YS415]
MKPFAFQGRPPTPLYEVAGLLFARAFLTLYWGTVHRVRHRRH